jgi:hypothetical protein
MDGEYTAVELLVHVVVGAAALWLIYHLLLGRRADFRIVVRDGRVECSKGLPLVMRSELGDFLLHDLALRGPVKILGSRRGGRTSLWFRGRLGKREQQRIRNYLANRL